MTGTDDSFGIPMAAPLGLEEMRTAEVSGKGFRQPEMVRGGGVTPGGWPAV